MSCLIQRSNGIWYGVFSGGGKRIWRTTGTTCRDEALVIVESLGREFISPRKMKILQFRDILVPLVQGELAPGTVKLIMAGFTSFARIIDDIPIRAVTPYHVEKFKSTRLQEVSAVKVSIDFRALRASFNRAVRLRFLETNPFTACANIRIQEKEPRRLSEAELTILLEVMRDDPVAVVTLCAVATGMRLGEILSLKWHQMDLAHGFIRLENRSDFTLKNRRQRIVPLGEIVKQLLAEIPRPSDYVFSNALGNPYKVGTISTKFKKFVRKAGLPEEVHFHCLRHTSGSCLIETGSPISHVQKILGHSSLRVTEIYIHQVPSQLRESVLKLDPMLERILQNSIRRAPSIETVSRSQNPSPSQSSSEAL
jgi:integrase